MSHFQAYGIIYSTMCSLRFLWYDRSKQRMVIRLGMAQRPPRTTHDSQPRIHVRTSYSKHDTCSDNTRAAQAWTIPTSCACRYVSHLARRYRHSIGIQLISSVLRPRRLFLSFFFLWVYYGNLKQSGQRVKYSSQVKLQVTFFKSP